MNFPFELEAFIEAAGDAIIGANAQGKITIWNPSAERIFGFTPEEALGSSLDLIIPERFRERHWEGYRKVMLSGETRYGADVLRVPAIHKDGRSLSIAFTVALLRSNQRQIHTIVAIVRDETARWHEERELRRRLTALEMPTKSGQN